MQTATFAKVPAQNRIPNLYSNLMKKDAKKSIQTVRILDLDELADVKSLHEILSEILEFPQTYQHDWDSFEIALDEKKKLPCTLVIFGGEHFTTYYRTDIRTLSDIVWRYRRSGRDPLIIFDRIEQAARTKIPPIELVFSFRPGQYGCRGDPHLQTDLKNYFSSRSIPENESDFETQIYEAIRILTGNSLEKDKRFFVEKYREPSGMSAGFVSSDFWLRDGIPRLIARYMMLKPMMRTGG